MEFTDEYESEFAAPPFQVVSRTLEGGKLITRVMMDGELEVFEAEPQTYLESGSMMDRGKN